MDIKTLLANLHDEVSCSVCMCAFTDPKQLPCLQSFCLHCLNGIQRTSGVHGKITCPECRRQFQISGSGNPSKLPTTVTEHLQVLNRTPNSGWSKTIKKKSLPRLMEYCSTIKIIDSPRQTKIWSLIIAPLTEHYKSLKKGIWLSFIPPCESYPSWDF